MNISGEKRSLSFRRSQLLFILVIIVWAAFIGRLFYVQIIKHDYYSSLAIDSQERKFEIDAKRGTISILDREEARPIVLNENLPTIFADPRFIDDEKGTAIQLAQLLGGYSTDYIPMLNRDTSYVVVKHKATLTEAESINDAGIKGVGTVDQYYRSYPEGSLAAQALGFVNNDGEGQYGVEGYLDGHLAGQDGQVEAITDVHGILLRGDDRNVLEPAVEGGDITLTIDINVQKRVEEAVKKAVVDGSAKSGSAIVLNPRTGAVVAMADYPTFNPKRFGEVEDFSVFQNRSVSNPYEVGSVLKTLTMSTGLDLGVVTPGTTYFDTGVVEVDGWDIKNAVGAVNVTRTMVEVIQKSVNTGVVFVLEQLGGGTINQKARENLYDYFYNHFKLGELTGIEQSNENAGILFGPNEGDGRNIRYANMTFGQGLTSTMIQVTSAVASVVNDGNYYKPFVVHSRSDALGQEQITNPVLISDSTVSSQTSSQIKSMMEAVVEDGGGRVAKRTGYRIGGKTGSAQVSLPDGTYSETREIGSFVGFVEGGEGVEYVLMTRVDEPIGYRFAGSGAAAPLFRDIVHWLIDFDRIPPIE